MEKMQSLSNQVYFDKQNNKIIKKYDNNNFKKNYGNQEIKFLKTINYKFNEIENGVEIEYIKHKEFPKGKENIKTKELKMVADALIDFHKNKINDIEKINYKKMYKKLLLKNSFVKGYVEKEKELLKRALEILNSGEQVILHNDLIPENILVTNDKAIFIDFEYSGSGNYIFDIASFITENSLTKEQAKEFCKFYDKEINENDLLIVTAFLEIFWARWAWFFEKEKNDLNLIYKEIFDDKIKKYNELIKLINF